MYRDWPSEGCQGPLSAQLCDRWAMQVKCVHTWSLVWYTAMWRLLMLKSWYRPKPSNLTARSGPTLTTSRICLKQCSSPSSRVWNTLTWQQQLALHGCFSDLSTCTAMCTRVSHKARADCWEVSSGFLKALCGLWVCLVLPKTWSLTESYSVSDEICCVYIYMYVKSSVELPVIDQCFIFYSSACLPHSSCTWLQSSLIVVDPTVGGGGIQHRCGLSPSRLARNFYTRKRSR